MRVGERIKMLREKKRWNHRELAKQAGWIIPGFSVSSGVSGIRFRSSELPSGWHERWG